MKWAPRLGARVSPRSFGALVVTAALLVGRVAHADEQDHAREPHLGRAALEVTALVGLGLFYYWLDPLANREDWDDPALEDRLTLRALRFDTNLNTTNHLLHPVAGGLVYDVARTNGLDIPTAIAIGVTQSATWELLLEWREKPSLNDLVYTALGGVPVGEFIFRAGDYLASGRSPAARVLATVLALPQVVNDAFDGASSARDDVSRDELGFTCDVAHSFRVGYEGASLTNDLGARGFLHRVDLAASFTAIPGYLREGDFGSSFADGNFTDLRARVGASRDGTFESDLQLRAALFGHYAQSIVGRDEDRRGVATMLGVGSGLRFQASRWLDRPDQLSTAHVVGGRAILIGLDRALGVSLDAEVDLDFASIRSLAYPSFVRQHGAAGTKAVLQRQGYAYALGGWAALRAAVRWGPATIEASAARGEYGSIEGLDREQAHVTVDPHGREQVTEAGVALAIGVFDRLTLDVGARGRWRRSALGDASTSRWDRDVHVGATLHF